MVDNLNPAPRLVPPTGAIVDAADDDVMSLGGAKDLDELIANLNGGGNGVSGAPATPADSLPERSAPSPAQQQLQNASPDVLKDLQERLGVKLEDLIPQGSDSQEQVPAAGDGSNADSAAEKGSDDGSNKEETAPSFQWEAFENTFKEKTGVDLSQAIETINTLTERLNAMEAQYTQATQLAQLQAKWGVDDATFNERLAAVGEYSKKLPPDMVQKLDNVDGALLIWAKIEQESGRQKPQASLSAPSILSGSKVPVTQRQNPSVIPASRFLGESPEQRQYYFDNSAEIAAAINQGLVDWNA